MTMPPPTAASQARPSAVHAGLPRPLPGRLGGAESPAGVAAGFAVVPVAAQVDLQGQGAVCGGTVIAVLIWREHR